MKYLTVFSFILMAKANIYSQNKVNKLSLNVFENFYSLKMSEGANNNVVRMNDGMSLNFKTYNKAKKKGIIYELMLHTTNAYYDYVLSGGRTLNVENTFATANFILPALIFYKEKLEQSFGVGAGFATLAYRDYYDQYGTLQPYNSTTLKEIPFGKFWSGAFLFDYDFNFKMTKKIGFNIGLRYTVPIPIRSSKVDYDASVGTSLGIKCGIHYQFK